MKFGIFYEYQIPRPWEDGDEHRLLKDALDQVELADRLGFDHVWEVEHHFLEEYSHGSAPEVFLAAASQRTTNIRRGHGIVLLPGSYNHTARVVERINTLDLLSDGRVEFGTGESSSNAELDGFGVDRATKRAQWLDHIDAATRMMVEERFAGRDGEHLQMPARNVVPKPFQKPHPPLWGGLQPARDDPPGGHEGCGGTHACLRRTRRGHVLGRRLLRDHRLRRVRARRFHRQRQHGQRPAADVP
ncbi:MAG: LLM class flavin-dependent oxidoreductase [Acidimicrobiales bacterium]|nr:LLM class flavin-dependent oxidoreductase [Acidimicrobiales bacterium]